MKIDVKIDDPLHGFAQMVCYPEAFDSSRMQTMQFACFNSAKHVASGLREFLDKVDKVEKGYGNVGDDIYCMYHNGFAHTFNAGRAMFACLYHERRVNLVLYSQSLDLTINGIEQLIAQFELYAKQDEEEQSND